MPDSAIFSVRGMGVADSVSTSTPIDSLLEPLLVRHAEALLLVDDDQPQIMELHILGQQPVGADHDVDLPRLSGRRRISSCCLARAEAGEQLHVHGEALHAPQDGLVVLPGQDGGGHQHGALLAVR